MLTVMCKGFCTVWSDGSFMLFRIVRLTLAAVQFANPYNWLCFGAESLAGLIHRRRPDIKLREYMCNWVASELYILSKLLVPLVALLAFAAKGQAWYCLSLALIIETVTYVLGNVLIPGGVEPRRTGEPHSSSFSASSPRPCRLR